MVTTTYAKPGKWEAGHIRATLHAMRQWGRRCGVRLRYTWVLELTRTGRPHYHLLVFLPRHLHLPHLDKRGWWPHGMTKVEVARNAVGYLAKYASKCFGAIDPNSGLEYLFPRGARICGGTIVDPDQLPEWRYWCAPKWARDRVPLHGDLRRVPGGYVEVATGEFLATPWRFVGFRAHPPELVFVFTETNRETTHA